MANFRIVDGKERVIVNDKHPAEWGPKEWSMFKAETQQILDYCANVMQKLLYLARLKGWVH